MFTLFLPLPSLPFSSSLFLSLPYIAHKRNRKTLKHNLQLVELLEIPQLVEACSRNGFHDEALELALFANSLESKFLLANELRNQQELISKDISQLSSSSSVKSSTGQNIVQNIVNDVHKTLSELRCHLLQKLSEEAALPKLLTILSSLRKLDGILVDRKLFLDNHLVVAHQTTSASASASTSSTISSSSSPISLENSNHQYEIMSQYIETSLQMSYLEARSIWIQRMISNVYTSSYNADLQNKILMNSLEINSEIQSNSPSKTTILSPPPPLVRASSSSNQSSHLGSYGKGIEILEIYRSSWFSVITQFNALFLNSNSSNTTTTSCSSITLLSHWIQDQIQHFIDDIHVILQEIDEIVSFKLFYEQVLLFSIRMSEIGCDFKEFTIPIFNRNLKNRIETIWIQGINQFQQMILTEKYTPAVMTGGDDINELENEYQVSLSLVL